MANTVKMPSKKLILPPAIGSYMHVFEAKANQSGKLKFSLALLWDKSIDLNPLKSAILEMAVAAFGPMIPPKVASTPEAVRALIIEQMKAGKLKNPLHDGDVDRPEDENYSNRMYLNASSGTQPGIVNAKLEPVFETTECYSGCTVRASVTVAAYSNEAKGIAVYLNNLQVVKKGPRLDGRGDASKEFAEFAEVGEAPDTNAIADLFG